MAWTPNTGGGWNHTTSTLEVWVFNTRMASTGSLLMQMLDPAKPVGIWIYGDPLGTTRYEAISTGGTGGNIVLNKYVHGTITGASPLKTHAHGLTTLDAYTLEVRWINGVITVYLNGSATPIFTAYDASADPDTINTAMGFDSATDGARVGHAQLYTLTQTFAALSEVAWWVANGTLYATDSGPTGGRVIGQFFDPDAVVIGAENLQHAIIEDGTHVVDFDAALMTAMPNTLTAGKMPDQTALNTPLGFSTSTFVVDYNDRVGFLREQYAIFSRIGDRTDLDLTAIDLGKAFVWPSQVGEPLLGAFVAVKNRLIMWARRSMWELTGDPSLGADVTRISAKTGGSGPRSACMVEEGQVFMHSDQGAMLIPSGGSPSPLSETVLTDILNGPTVDTHFTTVIQDTETFGIWIFLTPKDGSVGRHIFYDERTGRFVPSPDPLSGLGGGGFWPQTFAEAGVQPTCAMRYAGKVVFGTMDGRMMAFDKASAGTDGGVAYTSRLMLQVVHPDDIQDQSIALREFGLVMGLGSGDTSLTLFGGETPERAFDASGWTLWSGNMTDTRDTFCPLVSAPAIVLQLSATGTSWALEACQVEFGIEPMLRVPLRPALSAGAICQPPVTTSGPGNNTGGGPGPETGGSCTACATWMAANTTGMAGGEAAYLLGGPSTLAIAQAEAQAALLLLLASANICNIDPATVMLYLTNDNINTVIVTGTGSVAVPGTIPATTLTTLGLALANPITESTDKSWRVWFRCSGIP